MSGAGKPGLMLLEDALAQVLAQADALGALGVESLDLLQTDGRVLAADVIAPLDVPGFDNSQMDGYALRLADAQAAGEGGLRVSQRIPAGARAQPLQPGTAARVFTGAPLPEGADVVVPQEDTTSHGEAVVIAAPHALKPGQWIRRRAEDIAQGQVVLTAGTRLSAAHLGLAASMGYAQLLVARQPRVALFSTGDELVMPGSMAPTELPPGAIYNSNRYFLAALLKQAGCAVSDLGIVPDTREATLNALRQAAQTHDVVVTSGGVSVGEEDHVKPAVAALGSLALWQVNMKPGKPFALGSLRRQDASLAHFVGLPGNPVSSYVTYQLLVRPLLLKLQGASQLAPAAQTAAAVQAWPQADKRREFLRARINANAQIEFFPNQNSSVLSSMAWANCLVDKPAGERIEVGQSVSWIPI
jgi:molybdopterin molybdotransferase